MLLAIETSCDETAVSLFDLDRYLSSQKISEELLLVDLLASQIKLHRAYGGVVPELASREHLKNLPLLISEAFCQVGAEFSDLSAIAVTQGPGLKGCLLVGMGFSKALSFGLGVPLIPINHLEGHLCASELSSRESSIEYPALALLVSGGHTELVLMKSFGQYELVADTRDDAAGEAYDKSATLLGLPYPGGPELSRLAEGGDASRFEFPRGMPGRSDCFSFSGLKTAVRREVESLEPKWKEDQALRRDLAASIQYAINESLVEKTAQSLALSSPQCLILTGGVAANPSLRKRLGELSHAKGVKFLTPPAKWCTDNAAMIAVSAALRIRQNPELFLNWRPVEGFLGPSAASTIGVFPRFPL